MKTERDMSPESESDTQNIKRGFPTNLKPNGWTRPGFSFLGWALTPSGEPEYGDGATVTFIDDTHLYAIWQALDAEHPGFVPVFIIDTSGSMGTDAQELVDFKNCVSTIQLVMKGYVDLKPDYVHTIMYNGTYNNNLMVNVSNDMSKTLYENNDDTSIWNTIWKKLMSDSDRLITNWEGDEDMLLCIYKVINDTMTNYFNSDFKIGQSNLKGISIITLSDETVITSSGGETIDNVSYTLGYYNFINTKANGKYVNEWFKNWQDNANADMKFPSLRSELYNNRSDIAKEVRKASAKRISDILRSISRYYGVNIAFCLSGFLAKSSEKEYLFTNDGIPYVNELCRTKDGTQIKDGENNDIASIEI
jgi:hypothetical protein